MANETPSRPPPLMANAIKNFHFDFLTTSLRIWRSLQEGEVCQESQEAGGPAVALHIQVCAFIFDVELAQCFDDALTRMLIIFYGYMS